MYACPFEMDGCRHGDIESPEEWKAHMSAAHGGYSEDQKIEAGIIDTNENARDALGDESLEEAGREKTAPQPQRKKTAKEKRDASAIGKIIIRKLSRMPYRTWAALMKDPRFDLTAEEQAELTEAYLEIVNGMNVDWSNPKWAFIAALSINADLVTERLRYMGVEIPEEA